MISSKIGPSLSVLLMCSFLFVVRIEAASIYIENASFEEPLLPDHVVSDANTVSFTIPGWSAFGNREGIYNPSDIQFAGASDQDPDLDTPIPDGKNVAFIETSPGTGIYQVLGATLQTNVEYTLTASFGDRADRTGLVEYRMQLFAGNTELAIATGTLVDGQWVTDQAVASIGSSHPETGQPLRIEIWRAAGSDQLAIDLVKLEVVPEPTGLLIALTGFASLLLWQVR
ncbi:MAG: hypothetical protein DWQ37_11000 [Planctomycetota bacterium]|nr:MAG: hypothetical protein DWQ37_11000 [Planctomycetota bacterium]